MTFDQLAEKVAPTIMAGVIFAIFGLFMKVSYLEHTAHSALSRYAADMERLQAKIKKLEQRAQENREDLIVLKQCK
jgi:flavodoxin